MNLSVIILIIVALSIWAYLVYPYLYSYLVKRKIGKISKDKKFLDSITLAINKKDIIEFERIITKEKHGTTINRS